MMISWIWRNSAITKSLSSKRKEQSDGKCPKGQAALFFYLPLRAGAGNRSFPRKPPFPGKALYEKGLLIHSVQANLINYGVAPIVQQK